MDDFCSVIDVLVSSALREAKIFSFFCYEHVQRRA